MTSDGEIIGLFLQEHITPYQSAEETLDEIHEQGALSIVAHPFCSYRRSALRHDIMERIIDRLDIIEGFNSRVLDEGENDLARGYAGPAEETGICRIRCTYLTRIGQDICQHRTLLRSERAHEGVAGCIGPLQPHSPCDP